MQGILKNIKHDINNTRCRVKPARQEYLAMGSMLLTRPLTGETGAGHPEKHKT